MSGIRQYKPRVGGGVTPNSNNAENPNKTGPNRAYVRGRRSAGLNPALSGIHQDVDPAFVQEYVENHK